MTIPLLPWRGITPSAPADRSSPSHPKTGRPDKTQGSRLRVSDLLFSGFAVSCAPGVYYFSVEYKLER